MSDTWDVELYIYDLSQGFAAMMSEPLLGFKLEAIYHTAIVVYGKEYYYGGGLSGSGITELDRPGTTQLGQPMRKMKLGKTEIDQEMFEMWLGEMGSSQFRANLYQLFKHNCNNFSDECAQFLVSKSIPREITSMPDAVLNSPFGKMLEAQLSNFQLNPH
jgi:hypothetical protein